MRRTFWLTVPIAAVLVKVVFPIQEILAAAVAKNNRPVTTAAALVLISGIFLSKWRPSTISDIFTKLFSSMNSNFRMLSSGLLGNSMVSGASGRSREARFAVKNGGEPGGLANDGNSCFMNSVVQALASSEQLTQFLQENVASEDRFATVRNMKTNFPFTRALAKLLLDVNGQYGSKGREFSTKPLLQKMPNGPKLGFFSGYSQEDAQEFYQMVMRLVEAEYKAANPAPPAKLVVMDEVSEKLTSPDKKDHPETPENLSISGAENLSIPGAEKFVPPPAGAPYGCDQLGKLGRVYVPADQVDPNIPPVPPMAWPLDLVTPVDGVSAERIGCVECGEGGGIRYAVLSGMSLNLPYESSQFSGLDLHRLLQEWSTPEFIDDVNCNRCGLRHTRRFLAESAAGTSSEKLRADMDHRVQLIDAELAKNHVSDDVFAKLSINRMISKTRKTKQALLSRPPPLLCLHINRSVFDPRTYMIVKNSKPVLFPVVLDLRPYVAEPGDINLDARLPFKKPIHAEGVNGETDVNSSTGETKSINTSTGESKNINDRNSNISSNGADINGADINGLNNGSNISSTCVAGSAEILYNLKAVISHYGTHNYGHYICYRKLRGSWWRISDESVYVVTEKEVLNCQGTFMLFYEWNNKQEEDLVPLSDDENSNDKKPDSDSSSSDLDDIMDTVTASHQSESPEATEKSSYTMGEERAFHV